MATTVNPIDVMVELREILTGDADLNGLNVRLESGVQNTADMPLLNIVYAGMTPDEQPESLGAGTGPFYDQLYLDLEVYTHNMGEPLSARRDACKWMMKIRNVVRKGNNRNIGGTVLSARTESHDPISETASAEGSQVAGERMRLTCLITETSDAT